MITRARTASSALCLPRASRKDLRSSASTAFSACGRIQGDPRDAVAELAQEFRCHRDGESTAAKVAVIEPLERISGGMLAPGRC